MRHLRWFALCAVLVSAWGCSPSPEKVCKNFEALGKKDKDKDDDKKSKKDDDMAKCAKAMEKGKEASADGFKCVAKCSEMDDKKGADKCMEGCLKDDKKFTEAFLKAVLGDDGDNEKKSKKGDDDDDDKKKKKKKDDD